MGHLQLAEIGLQLAEISMSIREIVKGIGDDGKDRAALGKLL